MTPIELLAFEADRPGYNSAKDAAIRGHLGITPARYYQLLIRAAVDAEGMRAHPITARLIREHGHRGDVRRGHRMGTLPQPRPSR